MATLTRSAGKVTIACTDCKSAYNWTAVDTPAGLEKVTGRWDLHNAFRHDSKIELTESEN